MTWNVSSKRFSRNAKSGAGRGAKPDGYSGLASRFGREPALVLPPLPQSRERGGRGRSGGRGERMGADGLDELRRRLRLGVAWECAARLLARERFGVRGWGEANRLRRDLLGPLLAGDGWPGLP